MSILQSILIGTISVTGFLSSQTVHTLTLDDALHAVLASSPQLKEAEHSSDAAEARVKVTESGNYPSSDFEASYARVSPVSAASFGPTVFQLNPANNYDGHISVDALLYDFDRRNAATELSRSAVTSSRDRIDILKESLSYQTVKTFYTILFIQKSILVHNEELNTLNEHLAITKKKTESGTATDFDILTIQVRIAAARNKGIDLDNMLQQAEIRLKESAHIPADDSVQLLGSFDSSFASDAGPAAIQQALSSRLEMHSADDAITSASLQKTLIGRGDYPSLNFHFAYGIKNGLFPNIDVWRGNYIAALQLSVPIFDGFKKEYQEDEAEANVNAAQERKNFIAQQIRTEVRQAMINVQSNQDKVQIAQFTIDQAQKALEIARIKYNAGSITNLDLLDAETSLTEAQFQKVQALYTLEVSKYELDEAFGKKLSADQ
jgi:outer membrane protein